MKTLGKILTAGMIGLASFLPMKIDAQKIINQPQKQEIDKSYGLGDVNKDGVADERDYFDMKVDPDYIKQLEGKLILAKSMQVDTDKYLNPFAQPDSSALADAYGSGDVDKDRVLSWKDYDYMKDSKPQIDQADVNGDGILSTEADLQTLESRLRGEIDYMPLEWNALQEREERDNAIKKILAIDKTDTNTYNYPDWICSDFATLLHINAFGYDGSNLPLKYDTSNIGRFNTPIYDVIVSDKDSDWAHEMNAILVGDNPLEFNDWNFIEPQNDSTNVKPEKEKWDMPYNTIIGMCVIEDFQRSSPKLFPLVGFEIDKNGNNSLYWNEQKDLVLTRPADLPTIKIDTTVNAIVEESAIPFDYSLNQNYPNPFNSSTIISYEIPKRENVSLIIYDLIGKKLETLVDETQSPGPYKIPFDASKYSSGIYLYQLRVGDYTETEKMLMLK